MAEKKVLLVDDSKSILHAVTSILKSKHYHVVTKDDGIKAKEALENDHFDLVISDVDMPGINGLDLCSWIKSRKETAHTPVIILSSRESDRDIEEGFRVGADAYVSKSTARDELATVMESVLNKLNYVKNKNILLVEDSVSIQSIVSKGLAAADFNVKVASNGVAALSAMDDFLPDVIITDLIMPEMSGDDLCKILLSDQTYSKIPIIVMSSVRDKPSMQRLMQEGVSSYIVKPFNVNMLVLTVEKLLSDHFIRIIEDRNRLISEQKLIIGAIISLINALEARDEYTAGHSEEVTRLSAAMGKEFSFSASEMNRLVLAASLHDIGKIGIRDDVLLKPSKLTKDEFEHVKQHTVILQDILEPLHCLEDILFAASSHHEWWDGSGYPRALKGTDIPLIGRIIAIADVYAALTSKRPYRDKMSKEQALEIIEKESGTHFCPDTLKVFLQYIKSAAKTERIN